MADIVCPNCGKINQADAETCWNCLASLSGDRTPPPAGGDWLSNMRGGGDTRPWQSEDEAPSPADPPPPAEGSEPPDWLTRIRQRQLEEEGDQSSGLFDESTPDAAPLIPDWLSGSSSPQPAPGSDEEDWLASLRRPASGEPPAVGPHETPPLVPPTAPAGPGLQSEVPFQGEQPNWLSSIPSGPEPAPTESLSESSDQPVKPVSPAEPPLTPAEIPDWLSAAPAQPPDEDLPKPVFTGDTAEWSPEQTFPTPAAGEIVPDWLRQYTGPGDDAPPQPPVSAAGQPDWLSTGSGETPPAQAVPSPYEGDASLDWLSGYSAPAEPPNRPAAPSNGLPEWLGDVPPSSSPVNPLPDAIHGETPDWLTNLAPASTQPVEPGQSPALALDENTPLQTTPDLVTPFEGESMPDWLTPSELGESEPSSPSEPGETLVPALLPAWLQGMRPVEAAAPDSAVEENDQRMERAGPLKGLLGTLPGVRPFGYTKPAVYTIKLQTSDRQRQHAEMLESLLENAGRPLQDVSKVSKAPQTIQRILVAVILILSLLVPLLAGTTNAPMPVLFPPETVALSQAIQAIPTGAPVLVAVDYETSLAGELSPISQTVIEQLMARDARLIMISTVPAGPILAEQLLKTAQHNIPNYVLADKSINLGYLPGQGTGLQAFALNPQQATLSSFKQENAWNSPVLQGVGSIQNFAAVLVLTESADTARSWIEQIQPALGTAPLLIVTSAQSGPILSPYLASGQIKGLLSGLAGGAAYEQLLQKPARVRTYWDAYQTGITVMIAILVLGTIFQLIVSLLPHKKA